MPVVLDERYRTKCCCTHMGVDAAAHIVGMSYLVLSVPCFNVIGFAAALCVVLAKDNGNSCLYLPFLIVHVSQFTRL